ncbi:uncharacterized protein LOC141620863 [Silene latifolia]|uniref:uncharacterized protein LOC141620863 n=1 Tax=Silene latifolia TaxID=37657 RepID=UPI003D76F2B7
MPGLSPKIAVHRLAIKKGTSPKKQPQRRFRPELVPEIEKEVNKLIEVGFIREVKYSTWIANIVPVRKKNGQLRICVDFRDLNDACPKDDFPLPVTELMIHATTGHEALSFMDCTAGRFQPFSHLMKKNAPFQWDEKWKNAFDSIKKYLASAPVLGAPIPGKPLVLYIAAQERSLGAMCAQEIEDLLSGRLAKWAMLLKQYDLVFMPQKAVKGQAIADFFADHPVQQIGKFEMTSREKKFSMWTSYLHGKCTLTVFARKDGAGAGVVFVTPQNHLMPYSFTLTQLCSNNMAEYQALILGLQMAIEIGVRDMDINGDSKLVVNQVLGEYEVKKEDLIPYHQRALQLLNQLEDIHVGHVPRSANKLADALANLAANLALGAEESMQVPVCNRWVVSLLQGEENVDTTNMICVYTVDEDDWRQPIVDFLDHQKLPDDPRHKVEIRRRAPKFIHYKGTLYRRSFSGQWLRCLRKDEATEAMHEAHSGICGAHQSGPKLHDREGLTDDENEKLRLAELEALDEKRLKAQQKLQCYQARFSRAFNKKVRPRSFQVGDLVLAVRRPIITSHKPVGKFTSKWDGPYAVHEVYTNGAYKIVDEDGVRVGPINGKFLKRYFS